VTISSVDLADASSSERLRTLAQAKSLAAAARSSTNVFAIHPELGWPDEEWVTADPEFWRVRQR
jgi:hypothetical protein